MPMPPNCPSPTHHIAYRADCRPRPRSKVLRRPLPRPRSLANNIFQESAVQDFICRLADRARAMFGHRTRGRHRAARHPATPRTRTRSLASVFAPAPLSAPVPAPAPAPTARPHPAGPTHPGGFDASAFHSPSIGDTRDMVRPYVLLHQQAQERRWQAARWLNTDPRRDGIDICPAWGHGAEVTS